MDNSDKHSTEDEVIGTQGKVPPNSERRSQNAILGSLAPVRSNPDAVPAHRVADAVARDRFAPRRR